MPGWNSPARKVSPADTRRQIKEMATVVCCRTAVKAKEMGFLAAMQPGQKNKK
jgi:hypothetical protein